MNPTVLSKVFIIHADKVLLLTRSDDSFSRPGGVDIPGGHVDTGEDYLKAARREVAEETGILLQADQLAFVYAFTEYDYGKNIIRLTYLARVDREPAVILSHEHTDYHWVGLTDPEVNQVPIGYLTGLRHALTYGLA